MVIYERMKKKKKRHIIVYIVHNLHIHCQLDYLYDYGIELTFIYYFLVPLSSRFSVFVHILLAF